MMRVKGNGSMGRFSVEFEIANNSDVELAERGLLETEKVRRKRIQGVVDPGAASLVLPQSIVKELGLPIRGKAKVGYADRRTAIRPKAGAAHVELLGREDVFTAVVEPKGNTGLSGAVVLEVMDLLVDPANERLIPRDPRIETFEME